MKDLTSITDLATRESAAQDEESVPEITIEPIQETAASFEELVPETEAEAKPELNLEPFSMPESMPESMTASISDLITPPPAAFEPPASTESAKTFEEVREYGEKIAIGHPKLEASPAFSIFAVGHFDEKRRNLITTAVSELSLGIHPDEVLIGLTSGKLLIPRISEYAAVLIGQKIREFTDDVRIDLSSKIYLGKVGAETEDLSPLQATPQDLAPLGESFEFKNENDS